MKRIILQATLVALIATTVAPVVQANVARHGFNNLVNLINLHPKFYACLAGMSGIGIMARLHERFYKTPAQKVYYNCVRYCKAAADFLKNLREYDAEQLSDLNPNKKNLQKAFNALEREDRTTLETLFTTYFNNNGAQIHKNYTNLLDAAVKLVKEKRNAFFQVYSESAPAPNKSALVTLGKRIGDASICCWLLALCGYGPYLKK